MTQQELQVVASKLRKYGGTLLHIKIEENEVEAARVLIRGCALMNCKDMNGRTPLHLAAAKGFSNILVDLVSEGAKLNCKDKDDRTPLMLAAISKHYDCMRLLLRSGAQTDLKDKNGNTAFFYSSFPQINITCTNFGCTSSSSFLQETRKQGSLEQGLSFQPPHKSDVISIYFNRESLSEESVDIPYEVIPKKASYRLPLNFDFTINLDPSPFCKVTLKSTFTKNKFGKLNLGKGTTEPMNPINGDMLNMPGLDRYGITKSDALAAAQQIAHRTGSIEMATIYLSNAAVPTAKIRDVFGNEQTPWRAGDPPVLESSYEGSPEEAIACSTIVEGLMQMHLTFDTFKEYIKSNGYPTTGPFLYKDGIPYEKGNLEVDWERLFGNKIGKGRKVCLLKLSEKSNDLYYSVETHKIMFCRRMHPLKLKKGFWLDPEIKIFSTKHFCNGHYANGFCKIEKGDIKDRMCEKFKVL